MNCPICKSKNSSKIYSNFPGYIEGYSYNIFYCAKCDTQFISMNNVTPKIYEYIYSDSDTAGYDRYLEYAKEVKKQKNPLKYLSKEESTYYPVYKLLNGKSGLEILEVGCGYGYLTYSLHLLGHKIKGIDISKKAIDYAKKHFGNYFEVADLKDYKTNKKFDVIIATELIEHLSDPAGFISACSKLLKHNGKIILTTPNKDCCSKECVWKTDLPPVHTVWLSKNSFKYIAEKTKMNYSFVNFANYTGKNENKLMNFLQMKLLKSNNLPTPYMDKKGKPYQKKAKVSDSFIRRSIKKVVFSTPIRYACSNICKLLCKEYNTLGVVLQKKNLKNTK
jgi:ubiquinone biosynthesis O-methyltransferase